MSRKSITLLVAILAPLYLAAQGISFTSSDLVGTNIKKPTSLQFGPDGRLYASQQDGVIYAYTVVKNGPNDYQVTATETILQIQQIPNHDDDGTLNATVIERQITGLLVTGTAANPVLYVGSSDPRIGGGGTAGDMNLDTNSGTITKLTWNGSSWDQIHVVRGLPRSEENHANNGMVLDEVNNILYVAQGGNTNAGSPSNNFAFHTEYALSGAILTIDLDAINITHGGSYDIPTIDDPGRVNTGPGGSDVGDPFGGNDGLNQAKLVIGGPVQVYSPGFRNAYDLVLTATPGIEGRLYTIDNGANGGWGGYPENEGSPTVTNNYVPGEPGSTGPGDNDAKVNNRDNLHLISAPGFGPIYGGHPNPIRANPAGAGLYWYDNIVGMANFSLTPTVDWPPVPVALADPVQSDYQNPGVDDGALYTWPSSTNGMTEYTSANSFGGLMLGDILAASFDGEIFRISFNADGKQVVHQEVLASSFGDKPLDVVAQGPGDVFEGSIWVVNYGSKSITILEPVLENDWEFEVASDNSTPVARHEAAFVEANGKFYLIGGRGNKPVDIYDPTTQEWTSGTGPPLEMHHFQAVYHNGLIYVINAFTGGFPNETAVPHIYTYDPALDQWTQGSSIPTARQRGSSGVVVYQNKIYVLSGIQNGHTDGWVPWMDVYDPATDMWTTLPDAPRERDHFHAAEIDGKLYLAGGRRSGFGGSTFAATVAEVDVYNIATSTWNTLPASANIPTERAGNTVAVINSQLLVIGGESSSQSTAHNETEILDPKTNRWGTISPLNTGRHGTQAINYQGKIYVTAGSGNRGGSPELNTTEVLTATLICTGENTNYSLDDDSDGYSNGDETDNGTNPCSAASQPDDNDNDFLSDLNDDDDDNDAILDVNDLFPLDASNGTATNLPIDYPFLNGDPGFGLFGLGFTGLMANGTDYLTLYDKEHPNLIMGGAVGLASAPATAGNATDNTQEYAFHFGINVTSSTDVFTVQSKILGDPFFDDLPINQLQDQSQGIYIGTGDQDNYVKICVDGNNGTPGFRVTYENGGVVQSDEIFPVTDILAEGEIALFLTVVPSTGLVRVGYNTLSEPEVNSLTAVEVSGAFLTALQGTDALAVGLIATSEDAPSYSATWDFMKISYEEIVTGIDDPKETDLIALYPNPATSEFTLRFNLQSPENISVFLYDQLGQVLYLGQNALDSGVSTLEFKLDERGISQGIYYLKVATEKNPRVFKLIISE